MTTDGIIKTGFWAQFVVLGLLDWGTLTALSGQEETSLHYVGLVVLNVLLIGASVLMWRWLRWQRSGRRP